MATRKDLYNNLIEKSFENLNMIQDLTEKTKIMVELSKAVALGSILEVDHDENIGIVNKEESIIKEDKIEDINKEEETKEVEEPEEEKVVQEPEEEKVVQEPEETQEIKQEEVQETQEVQPEEIQEESNEPTIEAKTIDPNINVWTEETIQTYYNEISELKNYTQKLGEGEITKQVNEFSQGVLTNGLQDIGPANIESFLLYLKNILKA